MSKNSLLFCFVSLLFMTIVFLFSGCGNNQSGSLDSQKGSRVPAQASIEHPQTIVLICEDALRRDFLPLYGNQAITTPNLDKLASQGVIFDNVYSPSSWTKPVFASIFTGEPPARTGAVKHDLMMRDDIPTLAETLEKNHWHTALFSANPYTSNKFGLHRGFRDLIELTKPPDKATGKQNKTYITDFFIPLRNWLCSLDQNEHAFIVLHLMDVHSPYHPPAEFPALYNTKKEQVLSTMPWFKPDSMTNLPSGLTKEVLESELLNYCTSISYFDEKLAELLQLFEDSNRSNDTVFIFFSDHGEEMLDHGFVRHGHTLYNELIRVPLFIWGTGIKKARVSDTVNLTDLMPTILELAGVNPPEGVMSSSFTDILAGEEHIHQQAQFSETIQNPPHQICVTYGDWKLILKGDLYELYNLKEDPRETDNLAQENPVRLGMLRGMLLSWWREINSNTIGTGKTAKLDDKTQETLKGLGYVQN